LSPAGPEDDDGWATASNCGPAAFGLALRGLPCRSVFRAAA
jgi:hypothetical protein